MNLPTELPDRNNDDRNNDDQNNDDQNNDDQNNDDQSDVKQSYEEQNSEKRTDEEDKTGNQEGNQNDETGLPADNLTESDSNHEQAETGKTSVVVIIVGVVLTLLVIVCLQVDDWSRDWTTNFAETTESSSDPNLRPIDSSLSPKALSELVVQQMQGAERWSIGKPRESDDGRFVIDLVHKTLVFGFKDDVQVTITPAGKGSQLNATSQSRIGKGDLGQNPRNLRELVVRIQAGLTK